MKKIIAIAALAAAISSGAHASNSYDNDLTGTPAADNITAHSVAFNVNSAYQPLSITDANQTDATTLATKGDANRVIVASSFTAVANHQYKLSAVTVTGANQSEQLTASFSSSTDKPDAPNAKNIAHTPDGGTIHILLTQNAGTAMAKGSTTASYTVTDYAS
ncbi:hypothetical protein PXZ29_000656 [Salmonella enterica]|nr:hypothetical protein [Salmonella enterica]EAU6879124.1 hypothetical protein [Salmonella enterica]EBR4074368.1 hypothetical protein [Salmonella enterica]ECQ4967388.1 hypothetical protein [Salmonella enterica]EHL4432810.1 hypothetical protein [Salmonella enterica]